MCDSERRRFLNALGPVGGIFEVPFGPELCAAWGRWALREMGEWDGDCVGYLLLP